MISRGVNSEHGEHRDIEPIDAGDERVGGNRLTTNRSHNYRYLKFIKNIRSGKMRNGDHSRFDSP